MQAIAISLFDVGEFAILPCLVGERYKRPSRKSVPLYRIRDNFPVVDVKKKKKKKSIIEFIHISALSFAIIFFDKRTCSYN